MTICKKVRSVSSSGILSEDAQLAMLKLITDYCRQVKDTEEAVNAILDAADIFSRRGAPQSAYRILNDAEDLVRSVNRYDLLIQLNYASARACIREPDLDYAHQFYLQAFKISRGLNIVIADVDRYNFALLLMRLGRTAEALKLFKRLSRSKNLTGSLLFTATYHVAICLKHLARWDEAEAIYRSLIGKAEKIRDELLQQLHVQDNDILTDYDISFAAVLARNGNTIDALYHLNAGVEGVEKSLAQTLRPHFRKGFRKGFESRLLHVVDQLWAKAAPADLLPVLISLKKNTQSDWIAILKWQKEVDNAHGVTQAERDKLGRNTKKR